MVQAEGAACTKSGGGKTFCGPQITTGSVIVSQQPKNKTQKPDICSGCCFPWRKCSHHGQRQATNLMSQNAELRNEVCSGLSGAGVSQPQHPTDPQPSLPRDTHWLEPEAWCPGQGKSLS